jgi:hypothetical protein
MDLVQRQVSPPSRLKRTQHYGTNPRPLQLNHGVPHCRRHEAHLALSTFVYRDSQPGVPPDGVEMLHFGRRGQPALYIHAFPQTAYRLLTRPPTHQRFVLLLKSVPGVGHAEGEVPIIGEQKQSRTVRVQAANRINPLILDFGFWILDLWA